MKLRPGTLLTIALLTIVSMSSCYHEYFCQCEISYSGQPGLPDTTINEYSIKDTKDKAKSICEQNSNETEKNGIKSVENCHLY